MIIVPEDTSSTALNAVILGWVQKVFDGDGFLASVWHADRGAWLDRISFRLAFIDAPEMAQPFGPEAREFLSAMIAGRSLSLVPVFKGPTTPTVIDGYGRVLCVPFLTELMKVGRIDYYWQSRCASGSVHTPRQITRNIELEMVVNGWAWVVERYAFDREAEYLAAQDDARRHRRGLWSTDNPEPPWHFKRRQRSARQGQAAQGLLL